MWTVGIADREFNCRTHEVTRYSNFCVTDTSGYLPLFIGADGADRHPTIGAALVRRASDKHSAERKVPLGVLRVREGRLY
jgi:hypothetical protein